MEKLILQEFEYLLKAKSSHSDTEKYNRHFKEIKEALGNEYLDNLDEKIERWIKVTHYEMFSESNPVKFYFQAKMLYRDGFYEAAIVIGRSICEMFCYHYLSSVPNQYNNIQEIEKTNFRELINYIFIPKEMPGDFFEKFDSLFSDKDKILLKRFFATVGNKVVFQNTKRKENLSRIILLLKKCLPEGIWFQYDLLNSVYDMGNDYVHPKGNKDAKVDSLILLNKIGQVLFATYGIKSVNDIVGKVVQTAYASYPDICKCNHLLISIYPTPNTYD